MGIFRKIGKSFFDSKTLSELYQERKKQSPTEGNRNKVTAIICLTLLLATLSYLLNLAYSRNNIDDYVKDQGNIHFITNLTSDWRVSENLISNCKALSDCQFSNFKTRDLNSLTETLPEGKIISASKTITIANISKWEVKNRVHILKFPSLRYQEMSIFVNGKLWSNHIKNELILLPIDISKALNQDNFQANIKLIAKTDPIRSFYNGKTRSEYYQNFSFQTRSSHIKAQRYIDIQNHTKGNIIGNTARVIMAVFVLALFLTIDSSPETLGLSLFLGFEAAAIITTKPILGISPVVTRNFFFQMGDIFRLYFFFQLTRSIPSNVFPWLKWSIIPSILYGYLRYYQVDLQIQWPSQIPTYRDFTVGLIGTFICFRSAYVLRNDGLPWRVAALVLGGTASFEQLFMPAVNIIPVLGQFTTLVAVANFLQPVAAWLIAFCAFINISTLENRVKSLSEIEARAREITKEMELGNTVQKSFLKQPHNLPKEVDISYFSEAMLYVSGDTYFSNFQETTGRLTFLINDVTGHGVQAALKAAGVSVLAANLWENIEDEDQPHNKLEKYAEDVTNFYKSMDSSPDVLALCGVEFDTTNGEFQMYRNNFPTPFIVSPKSSDPENKISREDDHWVVRNISTPLAESFSLSVPENSFIIIGSDGLFESSRQTNHILKKFRKAIAKVDRFEAKQLQQTLLELIGEHETTLDDDKTLIVFHWKSRVATSTLQIAG